MIDLANVTVREYLRVSQDRSGIGKSPDQQHDEMERECRARSWRLHPVPYRDDNRSASRYARKTREGFLDLMADLKTGTFGADLLGIWESSRGSRRTSEWLELIDLCMERDVKIWVLTHGRVYDPNNARDRRSLREDASDAEYESDKSSERLLRDVRANAEKGRPHGKQIYGYQRIYDQETRQLIEVIPHPEQAPIVKESARRVLAGETFYMIAKDFNRRSIPPRRKAYRQQRQNLGWTAVAIKQMLGMPAYAGLRQHQGEILGNAIWPPLIDETAWRKLQVLMNPEWRKQTNVWPAKHLLSGIAVCGVCGAGTRIGKQNKGRKQSDEDGNLLPRQHYNTYLCVGVPGRTGFHVAMKETHLDAVVIELVLAWIERPDFMARIGQQDRDVDSERKALLDEIADHKRWLEQVHAEAERRRDLSYLTRQEDIVQPKIDAAEAKLLLLADVDPVVLELARSGRVREIWSEREEAGDLDWCRHVIRAVATPKIMRAAKKGTRGVDPDRVVMDWR
ncbi:recombinase family protein [Arthrobacter rhizosphaerae]|uniref:recombinase family protein n=1 Tax=Arthrobacter rhizosphaerae TaxID=2855490 RepID=UPI001FF4A2C1|nr:recombinase family protein [Arthrobacter rhizosphaerae]